MSCGTAVCDALALKEVVGTTLGVERQRRKLRPSRQIVVRAHYRYLRAETRRSERTALEFSLSLSMSECAVRLGTVD